MLRIGMPGRLSASSMAYKPNFFLKDRWFCHDFLQAIHGIHHAGLIPPMRATGAWGLACMACVRVNTALLHATAMHHEPHATVQLIAVLTLGSTAWGLEMHTLPCHAYVHVHPGKPLCYADLAWQVHTTYP